MKRLFFIFYCFILLFILSGCESPDKQKCGIMNDSFSYECNYNSNQNETTIIWQSTIVNDTIYRINSIDVTFYLYHEDHFIQEYNDFYNIKVASGKSNASRYIFKVDGDITSIELIDWSPTFDSFWNTYFVWIIVVGSIAVLLAVSYIVFMIVEDLELDDWDEYPFWIALPPLFIVSFILMTFNWVWGLIVLGGIVTLTIVILIAHFIKYLIDYGFTFGGLGFNESFDYNDKYVEDYIDDKEALSLFTVEELKEYCRDNEIRGYSKMTKIELIDLIYERSTISTNKLPEEINTKEKSKSNKAVLNSSITFKDIVGLEEAKQAFNEKIILPFKYEELYKKYDKKIGGGILLYGLPGTGKTMFAEAAANEINAMFIPIKCSDIKSKWYGESEERVKQIFNQARKAAKAIIFFDEFEAIGAKRTENGDNGNNDLVPQILAEMQGVGTSKTNSNIIVIAATNKPWSIDSAFMRPGRFDEKLYIPLPDLKARESLFFLRLNSIPCQNMNFQKLAEMTDGYSGADINGFCEKLKMRAIHKSIETNAEYLITMDDAYEVYHNYRSSIMKEDVERLEEFERTSL